MYRMVKMRWYTKHKDISYIEFGFSKTDIKEALMERIKGAPIKLPLDKQPTHIDMELDDDTYEDAAIIRLHYTNSESDGPSGKEYVEGETGG